MSKLLVAECPACHARYSVTPGQLKIADGQVRCGQCLTVFNAIPKKPEAKPPAPSSTIRLDDIVPERPDSLSSNLEPQRPTKPQSATEKNDLLTLIEAIDFEYAPVKKPLQPKPSQAWALLACFIALFGLAAQYLWFERASLANDPLLKPVYTYLCQSIDCTLVSKAGIDHLHTTHSVVRELPDQNDHLELITGLHNRGNLPVKLPIMRVTFTDIHGQLVAANDFAPEQYLINRRLIEANQHLDIRLLIQRPSAGHLGFEIDWLATSD